MKKTVIVKMVLAWVFFTGMAHGVSINPKGLGEVLIYPYYTVNQNNNFFYSIVNTTDKAKAVKVKFLEGLNGYRVLEYSVYLSPYDVWTGTLTPTTSTIHNHEGEPSVLHSYSDSSCVPFLNPSGQEFIPYFIDPNDSNQSMARATDGYLEVYDMGVVTGSSAAAMEHNSSGVPADCDQLQNAWGSAGYWDIDSTIDMDDPIGGLAGTAMILNVSSGYMMGYDATALEGFWQGEALHAHPGSDLPNLSLAQNQSIVQTNQGIETLDWNTGIEAVSAVLAQYNLTNEYSLTPQLSAKTEWVVTFPTKPFHTRIQMNQPISPFSHLWDGTESCEPVDFWSLNTSSMDRPNEQIQICHTVNILEFNSAADIQGTGSSILGSDRAIPVLTPENNESDIGWAQLTFSSSNQFMRSTNNSGYYGLPVLGFRAQSWINLNADVGFLAAYNEINSHKYQRKKWIDLIFTDGFEPQP